jgi:hypothetical protein
LSFGFNPSPESRHLAIYRQATQKKKTKKDVRKMTYQLLQLVKGGDLEPRIRKTTALKHVPPTVIYFPYIAIRDPIRVIQWPLQIQAYSNVAHPYLCPGLTINLF